MITKINVTKEQSDWLFSFVKVHNLHDVEEALQKLIDCYKVWNENLTKHNSSSKKDCYNPICAKRSHECLSLEYSVCDRRKRSPS